MDVCLEVQKSSMLCIEAMSHDSYTTASSLQQQKQERPVQSVWQHI
jgi:hypothetical protein